MLNNLHHLLSTTTVTSALAALPPKVAALGGKITLIGELADAQTMPTNGVTQERAGAIGQSVRAALAVAGPLFEKSLGERWKSETPLSSEDEGRLLRAGVAYSLAGDDAALVRLQQRYEGFYEKANNPEALRIALS
eukprot:gene46496-62191_t